MVVKTSSRVPKHIQTAVLLKKRIKKGDYQPGTNFPPIRLLGAEFGVSANVIQRAIQLLEKEGVVEARHGVGIRVLTSEQAKRTPLTFGMVIPYGPQIRFSGVIHCLANMALEGTSNRCIVKSSCNDPAQERRLVEEFVGSGIEGLILWPCEGNHNVQFLNTIPSATPLVLVDRMLEGVSAPGVVVDYTGIGKDIITYLGCQGYRKALILVDPLPISSFRELYSSMKQTVDHIGAGSRFDFVELETTMFATQYVDNPEEMVEQYARRLEDILQKQPYEAMFSTQTQLLDFVFIGTDLAVRYPALKLASLTSVLPSPRSLRYYQHSVREWVMDFGEMIGKAMSLLHDMVFLRIKPSRQYRTKFKTVVRRARNGTTEECPEGGYEME